MWTVMALVCAAPILLQGQAVLGSLLYADPAGRGIRLVVVDGGLPDRMTLRGEQGDEHALRRLVLTFAGPDRLQVSEAQVLAEKVPSGWTVAQRWGGTLIRAGEVTYWRYLPGQILPVRFVFQGQVWSLQSAVLPARRFPEKP